MADDRLAVEIGIDAADGERRSALTARGRRTRQAILDAAERVFGEQGYHNAGIVEITQLANVALGTFYTYFPDKMAAFSELVHTLNREMRREIRIEITNLTDRIEQERVGFETFFRFVQRHRNLYRIIRQAEFVDETLYRWHYQTLGESYVRALRRAQAAGQVRPDLHPDTVAVALMAVAEAIGLRSVLWQDELPGPEVQETLRIMLERWLRPEQP